tara:strand:- start:2334 stop:3110 length:777 start_codon:yes stop_codon:yes gene_type:complete
VFEPIFVFLFGACLGSFAGLLVYRVPKKLSIVRPASHCTQCKAKLPWYMNIPIFSCLFLRARCKFCKACFGWRHFFIELLMAIGLLALYWRFGISPLGIEYAIFYFGLITISFIDLELRIIPDVFSIGGIIIGLIGAALNPDRAFLDALMGVLLGGGVFWLIAYAYYKLRGAMGLGGGDIKLLAWIGSVLGLSAILPVIFISSLLGSFVGIFLMIKNRSGMATSLAFGPFLSLSAIMYLFFHEELARLFYSFFVPGLL